LDGPKVGSHILRDAQIEQVRLMTKVSSLYYEHGLRQQEIAERLHVSQARVSRLIKQATALGIVRTIVNVPPGLHTDLEQQVEERYGLQDVVLVEGAQDSLETLTMQLGAAAAELLENTLTGDEVVGLSSWSSSLMATVNSMRPRFNKMATSVVQLIGGVGDAKVQIQATRMAERLGDLTRGQVVFVPTPGIAGSADARDALWQDPLMQAARQAWGTLTTALVGVGAIEPSSMLVQSGNAVSDSDRSELRRAGAVGDICLHYFNEHGEPISSDFDRRVLSIDAETLRAVPRRIAVAGGPLKFSAIRASLRGGWVNVLVTDVATGRKLVESA
jgi:DNA-binding transcriptional regulator LsrR (DeoR family)